MIMSYLIIRLFDFFEYKKSSKSFYNKKTMKKTICFTGLVIFLMMTSAFTSSDTIALSWKKLGTKKISYTLDRDVIKVGYHDGLFRKLKIKVTGGKVNMHKMTVTYGNGESDHVPLRHNFYAGSNSRVLDLEGGRRVIKEITFWYDTKNSSKKKAKIHVFGLR